MLVISTRWRVDGSSLVIEIWSQVNQLGSPRQFVCARFSVLREIELAFRILGCYQFPAPQFRSAEEESCAPAARGSSILVQRRGLLAREEVVGVQPGSV